MPRSLGSVAGHRHMHMRMHLKRSEELLRRRCEGLIRRHDRLDGHVDRRRFYRAVALGDRVALDHLRANGVNRKCEWEVGGRRMRRAW